MINFEKLLSCIHAGYPVFYLKEMFASLTALSDAKLVQIGLLIADMESLHFSRAEQIKVFQTFLEVK